MSDFTSGFWGLFVAIVTIVSIAACAVLLFALSRRKVASDPDTTGHVWDEDLDELNNPLPMWWIWMFVITIVFSVGYLVVYPGLGTWAGTFKWTSTGEFRDEVAAAEKRFGPIYAKFAAVEIPALAADPEAHAIGHKLFLNYCTQCHSSDARGGKGFPNLTDRDWLYGDSPELIKASIMEGRNAVMPPWGAVLGDSGVKDAANFVRSLAKLPHDEARAQKGKVAFGTYCVACHGPAGTGNIAMGAPNLTDDVWLYGSSESTLIDTIGKGRNGRMPAHKEFLGEARVHLLAAYVYGLSHPEQPTRPAPK